LNHNEIEILLRLVAWGRLAREQVCAIATCGHRPVKLGSVSAIVRELRKKLAKHKIKLVTVHGFGFELCQEDCKRVLGLLANTPAKPRANPPVHFSRGSLYSEP
jgi:hypothetical protein